MRLLKFPEIFFSIVLIFSLTVIAFPFGSLHTFHTSLTRLDYRESKKLVEISIQLFTHDLVPILERRTKKRIDLEKTPDIDKIIFDYLKENFALIDKNGKSKELVWVGKELSADLIFVYVETPSEVSLEGFKLRNTLFFESFQEQTNLIIARYDGKKADLLFKRGDKFKEIKSNKSIEEK